MNEPKAKNDNRIRSAGIRMALKLLPDDLLASAPAHLEKYLNDRLAKVELEPDEEGTAFLIAPKADGTLVVITATFDKDDTVRRVVEKTDLSKIFKQLLDNLKEL